MDARTLGIASIAGAWFVLTAQDALIKWFSGSYPLHEVIFVRAGVAVMVTLYLVHLEGGLRLLRTRRLGLHLLRASLVVASNSAFFLALAAMPLAEAVAIFFIGPVIITTLSALILSEPVGPRRWSAVLVGLAGVIVMLRPGDGVIRLVALLPVLAATAYAFMQIITRRLGVTEKASTMAFYVQLAFLFASASMGIFTGDGRFEPDDNQSLQFLLRAWVSPSAFDASVFVVIGVFNAVGGYLLSQAYCISEASVVAPFEYLALPMAVLWGLLIWGDWPDATASMGMALIIGGGLYVSHRETLRTGK